MKKIECPCCDGKQGMTAKVVTRDYSVGGLPNVTLKGVTQYTCEDCGEISYNYGDLDGLHKAIALCLYQKKTRLTGDEIRFLRKYLGYSQKMFALKADLTEEHLCRIENKKVPVSRLFDAFMRLIVLTEAPCRNYDAHDIAIQQQEAKKAKPIVLAHIKSKWKAKDQDCSMPLVAGLALAGI
jgi:putative zinc finger/helix-turn-helix YgiT family protein